MCSVVEDILEPGAIEMLGLNREVFEPVFARLRDYWIEALGTMHGRSYLLCPLLQLRDLLESPEDWEEVGIFLADATRETYGNGSHDFVEETVPALIDAGIVSTKEELMVGIGTLLDTINTQHPNGRWAYDGGNAFPRVGQQIRDGEITSLDEIRAAYPPVA